MRNYHLAIDIGASSGRHILGWLENGVIQLKEVHRFENGTVKKNNQLCWDIERLFDDVLKGLERCAALGCYPSTVGIDTWGVDFILLDRHQQRLGEAVAYRDARTQGVAEQLYEIINEPALYKRSGIQKQSFNSIYQLYALKLHSASLLNQAGAFLMIPDYLHFRLTGQISNEYTNATTTQLIHPQTRDWDRDLIKTLGLPVDIFGSVTMPGTEIGTLLPEIRARVGFDARVVLPPTHDTASAIVAIPTPDDALYLSSGTWSLMGVEADTPNCSETSRRHNFSNEGGYQGRYRYLKNIMGLWMLQSIRKELPQRYSFPELAARAKGAENFPSVVDVNTSLFLAPISMCDAVREACSASGQQTPETEQELLACTYHSLARSYAATVEEIEQITGKHYGQIHIIGGGCQDDFLNELTAKYTRCTIFAGPVEATAIGNVLSQMLESGEFIDLPEARRAVRSSFSVNKIDGGAFAASI